MDFLPGGHTPAGRLVDDETAGRVGSNEVGRNDFCQATMMLPRIVFCCVVVSAWRQSCFGLAYPERDPETEANKGLSLAAYSVGARTVSRGRGLSYRMGFFSGCRCLGCTRAGRALLRLRKVIEWTRLTDWCVVVVDAACPGTSRLCLGPRVGDGARLKPDVG